MAPEPEVGLDPPGQRCKPKTVEVLDVRRGEPLVREVRGEAAARSLRASAATGNRCDACSGSPTERARRLVRDKVVEAVDVELPRFNAQLIRNAHA